MGSVWYIPALDGQSQGWVALSESQRGESPVQGQVSTPLCPVPMHHVQFSVLHVFTEPQSVLEHSHPKKEPACVSSRSPSPFPSPPTCHVSGIRHCGLCVWLLTVTVPGFIHVGAHVSPPFLFTAESQSAARPCFFVPSLIDALVMSYRHVQTSGLAFPDALYWEGGPCSRASCVSLWFPPSSPHWSGWGWRWGRRLAPESTAPVCPMGGSVGHPGGALASARGHRLQRPSSAWLLGGHVLDTAASCISISRLSG